MAIEARTFGTCSSYDICMTLTFGPELCIWVSSECVVCAKIYASSKPKSLTILGGDAFV